MRQRVSLAGFCQLAPALSSVSRLELAAADSLRYLAAAAPRYLTGYLVAAPGYHCSSPYNALLLPTELCNTSRMVDLEPDIEECVLGGWCIRIQWCVALCFL